jgi:hypothetical protein
MADLLNPKFWADGTAIVVEAPQIVIPLAIVIGGAGWWLRGRIEKGAREGLREQREAHQAYRQLAEAKMADMSQKLESAMAQMTVLEGKIRANEPQADLLLSANSTTSALGQLQVANNAITVTIKRWAHSKHLPLEPPWPIPPPPLER